ncbi:hypothetical protein Tco_0392426 [Tanacetum coccineum]
MLGRRGFRVWFGLDRERTRVRSWLFPSARSGACCLAAETAGDSWDVVIRLVLEHGKRVALIVLTHPNKEVVEFKVSHCAVESGWDFRSKISLTGRPVCGARRYEHMILRRIFILTTNRTILHCGDVWGYGSNNFGKLRVGDDQNSV